ncbi:porphobilinogen deaminase [Candidatus Moduliflexus flocculans]|uniref:Porphobilinogen deaminase n=1 Tax=Candidatus Moduliflexus flocculans TaxID=1499966 RepID=A0A0S6VRP8_9BACT|nr:porphobilinogen deaminase [Candidatus Moduliflexus flocculans]
MPLLRIATRKSVLAQLQTDLIITELERRFGVACEKVLISTKGDQMLDVTLDKIGGKGLFVKEIETALLNGEADAAVHSMKDVPAELPDGCELAAMLLRDDVRDAFVARDGIGFFDLPSGAKIGTSSRRREQQLRQLRPDIHVVPIRGNVQTRLNKLHSESLDGTILAAAGLNRLNLSAVVTEYFAPQQMIPAVGQGALGVEILSNSPHAALFRQLDDAATRLCVEAERQFMRTLNADCHAAIGAYARLDGSLLRLIGMFEVNKRIVIREITDSPHQSTSLGQRLAERIFLATP